MNDVNEKKGTFIHQKKRFKEDTSRMNATNGIRNNKRQAQDSMSSTTYSDKSLEKMKGS